MPGVVKPLGHYRVRLRMAHSHRVAYNDFDDQLCWLMVNVKLTPEQAQEVRAALDTTRDLKKANNDSINNLTQRIWQAEQKLLAKPAVTYAQMRAAWLAPEPRLP